MRTLSVKSPEQQALATLFQTRELLLTQKTQLVNALRAHLAEHGVIVAAGRRSIDPFIRVLDDVTNTLSHAVRKVGTLYLDRIARTAGEIEDLERQMDEQAKEDEMAQRLRTIPGVGPVATMPVEVLAPALESSARGRNCPAWLGLVPRQHSSRGKQRLGRTSKIGQSEIRRLLISGAMSIIHWRGRNGGKPGSWLARMLNCKLRMLTTIALANKPARVIWAIMTRKDAYRDPAGAVC